MDYLRIDIANHYGLDKLSFEDRIKWVIDNEPDLEMLEETASDFFRFAAGTMAYRQAQQGVASGHMIGLDACASGPQILSVISGCEAGARNTNAVGQDRNDLYGINTQIMKEILEEAGETMGEYERSDVKAALMPMFYGSKEKPKEIFGDETQELEAFYLAAEEACPGAFMLLPIMLEMWDPTALKYEWDLPDGFQVVYLVMDKKDSKIEVDTTTPHITFKYRRDINTTLETAAKIPANVTQSIDGYIVRELTSRCDYDLTQLRVVETLLKRQIRYPVKDSLGMVPYIEQMWKKHGIMSLVGVEHVNEWTITQLSVKYCEELLALVQATLLKPQFKVISIHDEMKSHPNYMNHVRQTYIDILCELADSRILDVILSDIQGSPVHIPKLSENLAELIRDSEYPLA
jgi:hypothetical protein